MIRLSYILLPRLSSFGSAAALQRDLKVLQECGYAGVELNLTEPSGFDAAELAGIVGNAGLVVPSLLTGEAYQDGLCLSSPDSQVRGRTVQRLIGYLEIAERFQACLVIGLLQGLRRDEPDPGIAHQRIVDCLRQVAETASAKDVDLVIEPVNHLQVGFHNTVAEVLSLIADVGSPAVRPMVDTVHLNIEERSLTQPIVDCGPALRHVHLCDSNGGRFGTGHVDFAAVHGALQQIGYQGFASVKVYRQAGLEEAARSSIDVLRRAGFGG